MTARLCTIALVTFVFACAALAQTTAFKYQGSLQSGGGPASGNYDFEFALFDALSGGAQLGSTVTVSGVSVSASSFAVTLDFGNQERAPTPRGGQLA